MAAARQAIITEAAHIRAAARDIAAEVLHQEEVTAEEAALHLEVIEDKVTSRKAS